MKVIIIRHGKVDYDWKRMYNSREFDLACAQYDMAPIVEMSYDIPAIDVQKIYVSTLRRSLDTAKEIFGSRVFITSELLNEVPLASSFNCRIRLPLCFWNLTGRVQWLLNSSRQTEKRKDTTTRARKFIDLLDSSGCDSAIVSHGFYMHTLVKEMQKAGFTISKSKGNYKNGDYVLAEKQ